MGWSCTAEQAKTLEAIDAATGSVMEDGLVEGMFYEHPAGGPDGKDYGTPGAMTMLREGTRWRASLRPNRI